MFQSIRFKLSLFIILLIIFTTIVFSVATIKIMNRTILNEIIKRAESLGKGTAAVAAYNLISRDTLGIDHIVFKGKSLNSDIEYMVVVDTKMRVIGHSDIKKRGGTFESNEGTELRKSEDGTRVTEILFPSGRGFEIYTPILFKGKMLGGVVVGVNRSVLQEAQLLARKRILGLFAAILVVSVGAVLCLSVFITRPIKELSSGVEELREGKRTKPLRVYSKDEFGKLTESFNRMTEIILEQQGRLFMYTQELEEAYLSTVRVLAAAIDARDPYTLGHSARVAANSLMIGEEIGLNKKELEELEIASLFHDVGKLKMPDSILYKSRSLDAMESSEMKHHPEDGADILKKVKFLQKYVPPVRHHHEFYNGQGYPDGLHGDKIPLYAAIIAIADTFDAMTSTRPYRTGLSKVEALRELENESGRQFHPDLVRAFLRAMEDGRRRPQQSYLPGVV